jgi:DNA-3-methyladenine glycosylase
MPLARPTSGAGERHDGAMTVRTRRVYDEPGDGDGYRVLVDRLWPRGLTKERAHVDLWLKENAPSTELRKAFHYEDLPFDEFARRYRAELAENASAVEELRRVVAEHDVVTLLYGASDATKNHTGVLTDLLA